MDISGLPAEDELLIKPVEWTNDVSNKVSVFVKIEGIGSCTMFHR